MVDMFWDNDIKDPLWLLQKPAANSKKRQQNKKGMYSPFVSAESMLSSHMQSVRLAKTDAKGRPKHFACSIIMQNHFESRHNLLALATRPPLLKYLDS